VISITEKNDNDTLTLGKFFNCHAQTLSHQPIVIHLDYHVMRLDQWLAVTLLNVFLAIAVDNLADAQELTNAEQNQAKEQQEAVRHDIAALTNDADTEVSATPYIVLAMFPYAFTIIKVQ
jgi:hypothetical protein